MRGPRPPSRCRRRPLLVGGRDDAGLLQARSSPRPTAPYLDGDKCRIETAGSGSGFQHTANCAPAARTTEHGRGLCLIRELADHVRIGPRPGRHGAVVGFDEILKWRDDAPLPAV
ncbi:ATP-binding protein [Streptomyces sp. KHY 26]|uniref:ATP-binding protein n=1 Tax=Streptomyces sp. KHY 26 TaxID=3097359 RepID=UPI00376EAE4E